MMMDKRKAAWVVICMVVGAIFAGAIAEAADGSHALAMISAAAGCVLGGLIGAYVDRRKTG